jgi:hypothetical protein
MSTYKKEREINHKGAEGAQRIHQVPILPSFVRLRTVGSMRLCGKKFFSLVSLHTRCFSPIKVLGLLRFAHKIFKNRLSVDFLPHKLRSDQRSVVPKVRAAR